MRQRKKRKNTIKLSGLVYDILAIFVILDGNSVYHALAYNDFHLPMICLAFSLILLCLYHGPSRERKDFMLIGFLFFYFIFYFVLKSNTISKEAYLLMFVLGVPIWIAVFKKASKRGELFQIFYSIENVVCFLALLSLCFWMLSSILHVISPNMSVYVQWGQLKTYKGYFGLHFDTGISNAFGSGFMRNSGLFTEAPMFALWLSIALSTSLFLRKEVSKKRVLLLSVTILTTLSTIGVFFVAFAFGLKYLITMVGKTSLWHIVLTLLIIAVLPVGVNILLRIYEMKIGTSSYSIRLQDYVAGYLTWRENPIFGSGYGNIASLQKYVLISGAGNVGYSNSIMAILGTGGIWNFAIYTASFLIPIFQKENYTNKSDVRCFFLCYVYLTIGIIIYARFIMAIYVAVGIAFLIIPLSDDKTIKMNFK